MTGVKHYEELLVYQLSDQVRLRVRPIVERPAFNRHWKLRDQMAEAAESACPCIAEGFSRFNPRENANLVRVARGSLTEYLDAAEIPGTPPPRHRRPRRAGNDEGRRAPRIRGDIDNDDRNL